MRPHPLALALVLAATATFHAQTVTPVPKLDVKQLSGTWYQIARIPDKPERGCISDNIELITPGDKARQLYLVDACKTKPGNRYVRNITVSQDKSGSGVLRVRHLFLFHSNYWVLALNDRTAILGSPNHKTLWLYSRTPTLDPAALSQLQATAQLQGYAVANLKFTTQSHP